MSSTTPAATAMNAAERTRSGGNTCSAPPLSTRLPRSRQRFADVLRLLDVAPDVGAVAQEVLHLALVAVAVAGAALEHRGELERLAELQDGLARRVAEAV